MQEDNKTKLKVALKTRITLVIFGLFLSFIFLEMGLRIGGFVLLSIQEYRNRQSIQQKGSYRIMCLGESTTQGQYPPFLEEVLNQRNMGIRFSVIDKGLGGTTTSAILERLNADLDKYHPDMVITMMGINDWGEHIPYETVVTSKGMLFFRSFRTYKLARILWLHIQAKTKEIGLYKPNEDKQYSKEAETFFTGSRAKRDAGFNVSEAILKKAIEKNPKDAGAYLELGRVYRDQNKFSQAEDLFKKALELNPQDVNAYFELVRRSQDQKTFSQAEDLFKKALELHPENYYLYMALGWFYRDRGEFLQVEGILKKAIELYPENYYAYLELGRLYREQGKLSQAEGLFKKGIELHPENVRACITLGWLYREEGKLSLAEDTFKKAIELSPNEDDAYAAISIFYEEMGKSALAKEYADKANLERLRYYNPVKAVNYRKLKDILNKRDIRFVCVQYPMRNIGPLKKIFEDDEKNIIFVDNEKIFKDAIKISGSTAYFKDMVGRDFGHCTEKGNRLLAENIANVILKEVFDK
ncbi:MAG: tetratricopeptide repeat protein [Candidatus Omnitrophica bacterium]|nr:tetratricopeptide repeat protein [Candidatus Omnitrophota bacterium]